MITGNKGEWSEVYALLKIIADRHLLAGGKNLSEIESLIFPIIKVLREESNGTFEFSYDNDLVLIKNNCEEFRVPISTFKNQAYFLLKKLKEKTSTTFSIPEIESFINTYKSHSIKAKSTVKSDIRIVIHDKRTCTNQELGFSIKSQFGGASTLLNPGKTTNFIFKIENIVLSDLQIEEINNLNTKSKVKDRLNKISSLGGALSFIKVESSIFSNNLILIDSGLHKILAECLKLYFSTGYSKTPDLVSALTQNNPLVYDLDDNHPFYVYKVKRFLSDIALGMTPSKVWEGELDATGGYLIVKADGEILCYHIYNRNEFEDYLFTTTKFDTASTSRYGFGTVYVENGQFYFKLNLQIRFL